MLSKNRIGHIQSPPLVAGFTSDDLMQWYLQLVGARAYEAILADFGADMIVSLAIQPYSRERFYLLVEEAEEPSSEVERALYEAVVVQEKPFSLTPVGLEAEADADGYYPYLKKRTDRWHWGLNDLTSKPFDSVREAGVGYGRVENRLTV